MEALTTLDPRLVWGLFARGIGFVYLISFVSLAAQISELAGSAAALPFSRRFGKMREDFPTWRRFFYFPTLLWVSTENWMLRALTYAGIVASALVVLGGPHSQVALLVCYACYLSLDPPIVLVFPWDSLLFEMTVLGLFLPVTEPLPEVASVAAPAPALAWAYRLLFFRLMFGFGKQKFFGSRKLDLAYLKGFLVAQPLPSPIGWYAQKLPMPLLRGGVLFMFLVEVPGPFLAFVPGMASIACAAATAFLMVGIQASGSYGYFSLATIVLCLPLLDGVTPHLLGAATLWGPDAPWFTNAFVLAHTAAALVSLPFNSWTAHTFHQWTVWYQLPGLLQLPFKALRALHPFRWVHAYGVFPPNNWPAVKMCLLVEVTWDGEKWHEMAYRFAPSHAHSAPGFVSPYHPRGDQILIYDTLGLTPATLVSSMLGAWDPYMYGSRTPGTAFCQFLLAYPGKDFLPAILGDTTGIPPEEKPRSVRVTTIMLEPVSLAEHRKTGAWWKRTYVGPHVPPQERDPHFFDDYLAEPELWHYDAIFWRRRSRLAPLMQRALAGEDPLRLATVDGGDLSPADVERFWSDFVPMVAAPNNETFDTLPDVVAEVKRRFDRRQQRALQRLVGRFSLFLVNRFEPLYLGRGLHPLIPVNTYFQLWMLAAHIIGKGKEAYLSVYAEPLSAADHVPDLTTARGLYLLSVFRLEEMTFEAQKLRLLSAYTFPYDAEQKRLLTEKIRGKNLENALPAERLFIRIAQAVSGFFIVLPDIREAFQGPRFHHGYPEHYPTFVELETGEVIVDRKTGASTDLSDRVA